jgi:hypothetical protein
MMAGVPITMLLEGFSDAKHPRGWHGRWVAGELHVMHGKTQVTTVQGGTSFDRERLLSAVQGAVRARPGRPAIDRAGAQRVVDLATGKAPEPRSPAWRSQGETPMSMTDRRRAQADLETSRRRKLDPNAPAAKPYKPPTEDAIRRAQKDGLEFGATPAPQQDRHGGFKVGDVAQYRTPSIVNGKVEGYSKPQLRAVSGLQRNGYLRLRDPVTGTTVDVHHSNATKIGPLHPAYRGQVVQDAYRLQNAQLAAEKAARARRITESALGALLEGC